MHAGPQRRLRWRVIPAEALVEPRRATALIAPLLAAARLRRSRCSRRRPIAARWSRSPSGTCSPDDLDRRRFRIRPVRPPTLRLRCFDPSIDLLADAREPTVAASVAAGRRLGVESGVRARPVSAQLNRYSESRRAGRPRVRLVAGDADGS